MHRWKSVTHGSVLSEDGKTHECQQAIRVSTASVHPAFPTKVWSGHLHGDVAVLALATPAQCADREIDLIELYKGPVPTETLRFPEYTYPLDHEQIVMVGWGAVRDFAFEDGTFPAPEVLQETRVKLRNWGACFQHYERRCAHVL